MTPQVYSGPVPEDVGGTPFPDGWEPDDDHDRGVSDEEFASVVFDEAFVQAATVHEPTAVERLLAAAQARAEASEAEARRAHARGERYDDKYAPEGTDLSQDRDDDELEDTYVLGDRHHLFGAHGRQVRWHRPVAWVLAVVMGIGMVALAFAAVYRGGSSGTRDGVPTHAPTGLEQGSAAAPSASAEFSQPAASATPRSP
ncbi:hypothetical protein BFF78_28060 [Streptomyces fodineus]|uniref:Uncharacterized protein n=1 Tax=Streptomyces fodineus TaxID=1904616 RepID=A0A1D7YFV4_9ACTN|nr:hypothetical protein [Streptomyces fodineus]AOR34390.1 hypothetical protein BFF78_28060 [Streptomyces fodineus]